MRKSIQDVYDNLSGRDVFIIGGGPSVNDADLSLLENKLVICINNAYKLFENPYMLYWCDESWVANHLNALSNHNCKLRFTCKHSGDNYIVKDSKTTGDAYVLKRTGDFGLDDNVDNVKGNNSGAQIINFLANLKVNKILLLGYDMNMTNGTHWHKGHGLAMSPHIYNDMFIPSINSMASPLKNLGIEVINCSLNSSLECFPKVNFNDYMILNYKGK